MRYTPETYAQGFLELLKEHPEKEEDIIHRFRDVLIKKGDIQFANKIISAVESHYTHEQGGRNIVIESARTLSVAQQEALSSFMNDKDSVRTKITPSVIAGARITIDDEQMIDVTLSRRLHKLFSSH